MRNAIDELAEISMEHSAMLIGSNSLNVFLKFAIQLVMTAADHKVGKVWGMSAFNKATFFLFIMTREEGRGFKKRASIITWKRS